MASVVDDIKRKTTNITTNKSINKTQFIIDSDVNFDDWFAILYMLQRSDIDIKAMTVEGTGMSFIGAGIRNNLDILTFGNKWYIPIAAGSTKALKGNFRYPYKFRKRFSNLLGLKIPKNPFPPQKCSAVDLLISTLKNSKEKVNILTLGPLTNIASAIQEDPKIKKNIGMIYIMGGAIDTGGNIHFISETENITSEWNIYCDPLAAKIVFASGIPCTLVPLDTTNTAPITLDFYKRFKNSLETPQTEFIYNVMTAVIDEIKNGYLKFWDPLAAFIAVNGKNVVFKNIKLNVITDHGKHFGRIVKDKNGYNIRVAIKTDYNFFEKDFIDTLNGYK